MPLALISAALGISFAFVWAFIAGMIVREGQLAVRRQRDDLDPALGSRRPLVGSRPHFEHFARGTNRPTVGGPV